MGTPLGEQLAERMLSWDFALWKELDIQRQGPKLMGDLPGSYVQAVERKMGIAVAPERVCVLCGTPTKKKCCSSTCQNWDWSIHKETCFPPEPHFKHYESLALPDYSCFRQYQRWAMRQDNPGVDIGYSLVSREDYIDQFGAKELERTCLTLAMTGRPTYRLLSLFGE